MSDSGRFLRATAAGARAEDLVHVLEVTRQMAAERDLVALLNLIIERTTDVMDADRSSLFLIDRERGELWSKIAQGAEQAEIRFPIGVGIAGSVAQTGVGANIPDAYADPRFNRAFDRKTGYRTRSVLCLPLREIDGEVVGVIQVLNKRDGKPFTASDEYLLSTLAAQAGVALNRARLLESYVEAQKLKQEMKLASEIQRSLLPAAPPALPGFEIAAFCKSADQTGGDYYDFLDADAPAGRCGIAIGDVSGHGLGAALVMVAARAMLRSLFTAGAELKAIVERMNVLLAHDLDPTRFMTFFLGVLESEPRRIRFTNAGHEPPIIYRPAAPDGPQILQLETTGMMLGVVETMEYPEGEAVALAADDVVLFCTDGLFEARDLAGELFGVERMIGCLEEFAGRSAPGIVDGIARRLRAFTGSAPQADDLTFVVVKVL